MDIGKLVKRLFIVFNVIFVLIALTVFGFAAYLWGTTSSSSVVFIPFFLFIGLYFAATGIFGLVGMYKNNAMCLKIYVGLVFGVLLIDVVIGIGGAIEKKRLFFGMNALWDELNQEIKDSMQQSMGCCGYHGPSEYNGDIPASCYQNEDSSLGLTNLNPDSCRKKITRWMNDNVATWMIPQVIIMIIELCLLFTACKLLRSSKQKSQIVDSHGIEKQKLIKDMNEGKKFKGPAFRTLPRVSETSNDYAGEDGIMQSNEHIYSNPELDEVFGATNEGFADDEQTEQKSPMNVENNFFRMFDTPMHTIGKKTPENFMSAPIDTSFTPHPPPARINHFNMSDYGYVHTSPRSITPVEIAPPPLSLMYKDKRKPMRREPSIPTLNIATPAGAPIGPSPIPSIYTTKEHSSASMYTSLSSITRSTPQPSSSASTPPPPASYDTFSPPPAANYTSSTEEVPDKWASKSPRSFNKHNLPLAGKANQSVDIHRTQSTPAPDMTKSIGQLHDRPTSSINVSPPQASSDETQSTPKPFVTRHKRPKRSQLFAVPSSKTTYDTGVPPPAASYRQPTSMHLTASLDKWGDVNMADVRNVPDEILHEVRKGNFDLKGSSEC